MQCPNDQTTLSMTDRQGIEIDYCPTCRGVWLDRGELDKLIANNENSAQPAPMQQQHYNEPQRYNDNEHRPGYSDDRNGYYKKKHKKESFLGDLFDF